MFNDRIFINKRKVNIVFLSSVKLPEDKVIFISFK